MTTATERPQRTVSAIVRGKEDTAEGYKLTLEIPVFQSKYPTIITRVPAVDASQLQTGQTYNVILERQNLKPNKTGEKAFDYYYGWVNLDESPTYGPDGEPGPAQQPARQTAQGSAPRPQGNGAWGDGRNESIENQVLFKEARLATEFILLQSLGVDGEKDLKKRYTDNVKDFYAYFQHIFRGQSSQ